MMQNKKAVVVDFDGTLVSVNSFESFYIKAMLFFLKRFRIAELVKLLGFLLARKMRLIKHCQMKRNALLVFDKQQMASFLAVFSEFLHANLNNSVLNMIMTYKQKGYVTFLCTAAPEIYVLPFLNKYGFSFDGVECTHTPRGNSVWIENIGENKKKKTLEVLMQQGFECSIFITDSHDDLPLLSIPKEKNILVNPTRNTLKKIQEANIDYEILK